MTGRVLFYELHSCPQLNADPSPSAFPGLSSLKTSEIHNLIAVAPNLVVLVSTISLWRVDYYAMYSYVWCNVNFAYTLFICNATTSVRTRVI